jgi:hypothetical protein
MKDSETYIHHSCMNLFTTVTIHFFHSQKVRINNALLYQMHCCVFLCQSFTIPGTGPFIPGMVVSKVKNDKHDLELAQSFTEVQDA